MTVLDTSHSGGNRPSGVFVQMLTGRLWVPGAKSNLSRPTPPSLMPTVGADSASIGHPVQGVQPYHACDQAVSPKPARSPYLQTQEPCATLIRLISPKARAIQNQRWFVVSWTLWLKSPRNRLPGSSRPVPHRHR